MNSREERDIAERACWLELGRDPYRSECAAVHAVSDLETNCGAGWKGPGVGSNNWGAVQATKAWRAAGGKVFEYRDTHPNPDGTSTSYAVGFRVYDSPLDGCRDVVQILIRMGVLGDAGVAHTERTIGAVSRRMYQKGYYEGFGKTPEDRIANHARTLGNVAARAARELGEPPGLVSAPPLPADIVIHLGPELPGPAPVIELTPEQLAALAADALRKGSDRRAARDLELLRRAEDDTYQRVHDALWQPQLLRLRAA